MATANPIEPGDYADEGRGFTVADYPYVMRLPDGRAVCIEIPGHWIDSDQPPAVAFKPEAMDFLDRVRAVFSSTTGRAPHPGYFVRLREGLGLTQRELGELLGVDRRTISRWERGVGRPGADALRAVERVRIEAVGRGVAIEA